MTPTREQLELAAKAAGYLYQWHDGQFLVSKNGGTDWLEWQPVTDKSDSFDLRVAIDADINSIGESIVANLGFVSAYANYKDRNNDKGLATMWAVFLCAVEIGKSL